MGRINTTNAKEAGLKTVGSSAGFSAGDLIYQTASDTGLIPDDYIATGNFQTKGRKTLAYRSDDSFYNKKSVDLNHGFMVNGTCAATLSNGNVVTVHVKNYNQTGPVFTTSDQYKDVYFKIEQPDGTIVVDETKINPAGSTTTACGYDGTWVDVSAGPNGGFIVAWSNYNQSNFHWRVYGNDGTASEATQTFSTRIDSLKVGMSSTGKSFVFYMRQSDNQIRRVYTDTDGTQINEDIISASGSNYVSTLTCCSDSSGYVYFAFGDSSNRIRKVRCDSSTGNHDQDVTVSTDGSNITCPRIAITSGGTLVLPLMRTSSGQKLQVWYEDTAGGSWSAGPLLSITYSTSTERYCTGAVGEIADDVFYYMGAGHDCNAGVAFSSSGAALGPVLYNVGAFSCQGPRAVIRTGSTHRIYAGDGELDTSYAFNVKSTMFSVAGYFELNSSYQAAGQNLTQEIALANTTAAVDGYVKSSATPVSASFYAESDTDVTNDYPRTTDPATFVLPQTQFRSGSVNGKVRGYELDDGRIVVVLSHSSSIIIYILNADYSVQSTETIVNTGSFSRYEFDFERLNSGKFIIGYNLGTNYYVRKYSSSMVEEVGETLVLSGLVANSTSYSFCLAAVTNPVAEFVLSYSSNAGYGYLNSFREDLTAIGQVTVQPTYTSELHQVVEVAPQMLMVTHKVPAYGNWRIYALTDTNGNGAYTGKIDLGGLGNTSYNAYNAKPVRTSGGQSYLYMNSSASMFFYTMAGSSSSDRNDQTLSSRTDSYRHPLGVTGNGTPVVFGNATSYSDANKLWVGTSENMHFITADSNLGLSLGNNNSNANGFIIAGAGDTCHIVTQNSSSNTTITKIRIWPEQVKVSIQGGVSECDPVTIPSSTAAFLGVSATDCDAGGTALVQGKGAAVLSNSYPADTAQTNFDFRQPTTEGVSGSINGRNVTLGE